MKEYLWRWLFWASLVFCSLLATSLLIAYWLFSTAPHHPNTPVFAVGFALTFGFIGLGSLTMLLFSRISRRLDATPEEEGELFRKLVRESPFFAFSLLYFFSLLVFMGIFLLMIPYIKNACA